MMWGSRNDFCNVSYRQKRNRILKSLDSLGMGTKDNVHSIDIVENDNIAPSVPAVSENEISYERNEISVDNNTTNFITDTLNVNNRYQSPDVLASLSENVNDNLQFAVDFKEHLKIWVLQNNISHKAVNDLLGIMKKHAVIDTSSLPFDVRSLLQTPRNISSDIINICGGEYFHFGVPNGVKYSFDQHDKLKYNDVLKLNINIDGLPLSKSSGSQFWPILGEIVSSEVYTTPFAIGIYHGMKKPSDVNQFLRYFVEEMSDISKSGIEINGQLLKLEINAIICDAPAKAMVTGIKNHNGYFGCSKCIIEGEYVEHAVVFPEITCPLRTDESFMSRNQPEHHQNTSVLEDLGIGMVTQIPLDYMHLVCLGVTKKLIQFWVKGNASVRLKLEQIKRIDNMSKSLIHCISNDFARVPRSLQEVDRWKATEFRLFLLYTGPVLMRNILSKTKYMHFLCLSIGIRILCNKSSCDDMLDYANSLLQYFVQNFGSIYGLHHVSYNVHNLIHLLNDVKTFGPLDCFSAFKFENYMSKIKQKIKHSRKPLQQIVNRILEARKVQDKTICKSNNSKYTTSSPTNFIFGNLNICSVHPNNYYLLKSGEYFKAHSIVSQEEVLVEGIKYHCNGMKQLFETPCKSSLIGIFVTSSLLLNEMLQITMIRPSEIKCKCLKLELDVDVVFIPILHTNESI